MKNANPEIFKILEYWYWKDVNNVYYGTQIIKNTNPNTFKVLNTDYSTDEVNCYFLGKITNKEKCK